MAALVREVFEYGSRYTLARHLIGRKTVALDLWERGRVRITSVKTEHHEGHAERWIPLFPELRPVLQEAFDSAPEGTLHVVRKRKHAKNWRTTMQRIRRAGFEPWGKPFQNCRSTRETELLETYPIHVVAQWMGHSPAVALKHYTQTTDDHYAKAAEVVARPVAHETAQTADAVKRQSTTTPHISREMSQVG